MRRQSELDQIRDSVQESFRAIRRILSFEEYLDRLLAAPKLLRTAAQYTVDMFRHFGIDELQRFGATVQRFRLFDDANDSEGCLCGHERVQADIFRILKGLSEEAHADRLILLHGPNGSAKTTVVKMIQRGLERYSAEDEGALYRLHWVFPKAQTTDSLGFGGPPGPHGDELETFAFLKPEDIAARIPCELRDPPIFLVPMDERRAMLDRMAENLTPAERGRLEGARFREGDLSPKSKAIYEGLLAGYQGDWRRVIRHVQVERYFVSRRFRTGAITIDPQMHVDATVRAIAVDRSVDFLPPMLQNIRLNEPGGDLVDANGGVVEYGDFLKRPLDMNKYLLQTVETGTVNLAVQKLHLDLVFMGSTNENHLDAFKKSLDFTSFKARMELVQVPYLLRYSDEESIYGDLIRAMERRKRVLPHTVRVAALWAVLTRLQKPDRKYYEDEELGTLVDRLTPMEKATLYDRCTPPAWMKDDEKNRIRRSVQHIREEFADQVYYEGRFGASPREVKTILQEASHRRDFPCLSPLAVIAALREFVRETHVYDFLKLEPNGKFNDNVGFIDVVCDEYHTWVTAELESSMELIDEEAYDAKCDAYFTNVIAYTRNERVRDERTGKDLPADEAVMATVERVLEIDESMDSYRKNLVARIGAFRIDNPDAPVVYSELFPEIFTALRQDFYETRRAQIDRIEEHLLTFGEEPISDTKTAERVELTIRNMKEKFGYCDEGLKEVIRFVQQHRKLDS